MSKQAVRSGHADGDTRRASMARGADARDPAASAVAVQRSLPSYLDGEVRLFNFGEDGVDRHTLKWFFAIHTELLAEWQANGSRDGFIHDQAAILECFVRGTLYGLCMAETQSLLDNVALEDPHFMTTLATGRCCYRFPVFCAVSNDRIELLWVAERMRRRGLATLLVSLLRQRGVKGADGVDRVPGALAFWQRVGAVAGPPGRARACF